MTTTAGPASFTIATADSSHMAPGPPTPSGGPAPVPPPPGGQWIPAPYLYMARSATLHPSSGSGARTEFGGHRALVHDSYTDVENPGNMPAKPAGNKPTGGDLSNMAIIGVAQVSATNGSRAYSKAKKFAVTTDPVSLCIPGENQGKVHLSNGVLIEGAAPGMTLAEMNKHCATVVQTGDPVNVVTGAVLDQRRDLLLPGTIELELVRTYDSTRALERSPFGRGGFTHSHDRWIEIDEAQQETRVRLADGRFLAFPLLPRGGESFSRGKQLTLRRGGDDLVLRDEAARLTYYYESSARPVVEGVRRVDLRAVRDAWGNEIALDHEEGVLRRIRDTAHREIRFTHDAEGRVTRAEAWGPTRFDEGAPAALQCLQHVEYGYDADGDLAVVTDALGHQERYLYDERHRLVAKTLPNGLTFRYVYDAERDRCVQSAADGGLQKVELVFDDAKRITTVHGTLEPRRHTHDATGTVLETRTLDGSFVDAIEVDDDQLVVSRRNAAGAVTTYEYDDRGHPTRVTRADGTAIVWTWQDDLLVSRTDPGGRTSTCEYDGRGGLVRWVQPSGRWRVHDIDRWGRITAVRDARGIVVAYAFDLQHNVVRETDARGAVTEYAYDALGRMTQRRDALGRVSTWSYDALGRPVRETLPDGTVLLHAWDAMGNVTSTFDGTATDAASYGGTGVVTTRTLPDESRWTYVHDALERLREVRNARGESHRVTYDRAGRICEERFFDGQITRYRWGRGDLVHRIEHADESWIERSHDDMGRVVKETRPDGSTTIERNEIGWPVVITATEHFGDVVTELDYDVDGAVRSCTVDGRTVTYTHDEMGLRTSRTLPNGEVTRYAYDLSGALIAIEHEGENVFLDRDVLGREILRRAPAWGVEVQSTYDADDRLASIAANRATGDGGAATPLVRRSWARGKHGRLAAVGDSSWGQRNFSHDRMGRLLGWQRGAASTRYGYDAAGYLDRIDVFRPDIGATSESRLALHMGNVVAAVGARRFEHDERRRRRRSHGPDGETSYYWDTRSRLREVHLPGGRQVHFAYDGFDRLVRELLVAPPEPAAPGRPPAMSWLDYVWDGNELAMTIDSEGRERVFVHEPGSFFPVLQREDGESFLYLTDPLGVPTELIDRRGRVASAWLLGPYGELVESTHDPARERPVETPFRLLGQVFHPALGLSSTLHRWFDASIARWLTPDPVGLFGGPDLHGFDGSPTERVDRLGLYTAATFERFLADTRVARIQANQAALSAQRGGNIHGPNRMGPATAAASQPFRPGQPGPATSQNDGTGPDGHAERNPLTAAQGGGPGPTSGTSSSGSGAVGAGRPHCGACTQAIINTPGAVPSSRIRGATTDADGNPTHNGGFSIPSPGPEASDPASPSSPTNW